MQAKNQIVLFDGICNLCNGTVDFLMKHDRKNQFTFIPLQSKKGQILIEKYEIPVDLDSVVFIKSNQAFFESDAVIEIAGILNYPWKLGVIGKIIPRKIRNSLYRTISKNRYRWFGKRQTCRTFKSEDL